MSLHRWHWLIYEDKPIAWGLALMRSWLSQMGPVPEGVGGTPYTTGERIVNAILYIRRQGLRSSGGLASSLPEDIRAALLQMAYHVARSIEYHGARGTGNHIINNARALFFSGQVLRVEELSNLALAIIQDALPWLVTADGFLREESSHYHLLFTRWIMEIYELAKETHHQEMENCLEPWVTQCAKKCEFFLVQNKETGVWQIPLIGDVSPDCTPEWLINYLCPLVRVGVSSHGDGMRSFPESGWFRFDHGATTIFWHAPQSNMIHRATHGHADLCSFVLYHKGQPIVIDPGRPAYQSDEGCLVEDHNSLTVDGLGPFLYDRAQKFPPFHQTRLAKCDWKQGDGQFIFSLSHTGFERLTEDHIEHTRLFRIGDGILEIEDQLRGSGVHQVEAFFYAAPGVKLTLTVNDGKDLVKEINSWTSPQYGATIPTSTLTIKLKQQFPVINHFKLEY